MPVIALGRTEEETEKRLGAAVAAGQSLVTIDNANGELSGDFLCQLIERPRPQVLILGRTQLIEVDARSTSLFANGNNLTFVGDIVRRAVRARLDPKMERPELREFNGDPFATVLTDRGAYIAAALTIVAAYVAAGRPYPAPRLASFEGWSDTVRSALIWLGEADAVGSMEASRTDDPSRSAQRDLMIAWANVFGTGYRNRVVLRDVVGLACETKFEGGGSYGGGRHVETWPPQCARCTARGKRSTRRPSVTGCATTRAASSTVCGWTRSPTPMAPRNGGSRAPTGGRGQVSGMRCDGIGDRGRTLTPATY
jgi:hypothetical protein